MIHEKKKIAKIVEELTMFFLLWDQRKWSQALNCWEMK